MKKIFILFAAVMMAVSVSAQKNEIGAVVGGMDGLSYKHWFNDALALQADLAAGLTQAAGNTSGFSWNAGVWDFTVNPMVLYHWQLPANFKIYTGGGLNFGMMSYLNGGGALMGKFGINAAVGTAYHFSGAPVVLALDFRPGYGLGFRDSNFPTLNYFDWKLAFAVRYAF